MKLIHNIKVPRPLKSSSPLILSPHTCQTPQKQQNIFQKQLTWSNEFGRISQNSQKLRTISIQNPTQYQQKYLLTNRQRNKKNKQDYLTGSYHSFYHDQIQPSQHSSINHQFIQIKQDISSLKQLIHTPINQHYQSIKIDLNNQLFYLFNQNKIQIAKCLRQGLIKINDNMKKQCVTQFSRQFLPLSYLDDSERQFLQIKEKIKQIQQQIITNNFQCQFKQSIKPYEQQFRKNSFQSQKLKQTIKQLQNAIKIIQFNAEKQIKLQKESIDKKIQLIQKEVLVLQLQKQQKKRVQVPRWGKYERDNSTIPLKHPSDIINQPQLSHQHKNKLQELDFQYENNQKQILIQPLQQIWQQHIQQNSRNSNIIANKSISLTFSMQSQNDVRTLYSGQLLESMKSIKGVKSSKYILDNQNNLMDDTGNYILDDLGNQIQLTEEQVFMIRKSNIVKFKEI